MSPSEMLFPETVKEFTRVSELFVTTAPLKAPYTGVVRAVKLSIFRVVLPLVVPVERTFTDRGRLVSLKVAGSSGVPVPSGVLYQVGVVVNAAVPGATPTERVTAHEPRLAAWVCSMQL